MADIRAMEAIDRLERALSRVEAAASLRPAANGRGDDNELKQLREVHQTLRTKVEAAISQIDRMLEDVGRVEGA